MDFTLTFSVPSQYSRISLSFTRSHIANFGYFRRRVSDVKLLFTAALTSFSSAHSLFHRSIRSRLLSKLRFRRATDSLAIHSGARFPVLSEISEALVG